MLKTVLAYGSLLNEESRKRTLQQASGIRKVNLCGYRRCFELLSAKREREGNMRTLLTIRPDENAVLNAIIVDIDNEEGWERLLKRETTYTPILVTCRDFDTNEEIKNVTTFFGFPDRIFTDLPPDEEYMELCRKGAYSFGEVFGRKFDETTFLGDGRSLAAYIKEINK